MIEKCIYKNYLNRSFYISNFNSCNKLLPSKSEYKYHLATRNFSYYMY